MSPRLDPAVAHVRQAVRIHAGGLEPGSSVVVAVSGGADSLALAAGVAFVAPREGWNARAVVIDHDLQEGSDRVARTAADQVASLSLDVEVIRVRVGRAGGPEAAARDARYGALEATGADAVLLGHTRDDQAETVLLGLGRGSGPRSIAGMRPIDGRYRRPLLDVTRAETRAVCRAVGLQPWDDPHNADPAYRRVRIRTEALPLLEDVLGGGVRDALARTAAQIRDDDDHLDALAAEVAGRPQLSCTDLAALPRAIRTRVLLRLAREAGARDLGAVHVAALEGLVIDWRGQAGVDLPGGMTAGRRGGTLWFARRDVAG